ncbi:MAG: hypothetical protein ABIH65_03035 [Nanoarchaeota archaeon]
MKKIKEVSFKYKNKNFRVNVKVCDIYDEIFGLMFKTKENADALLFDFKKPIKMKIHSVFVFFPFLAIWLNKKNKVLEIKKIKPFTFIVEPPKFFNKLIEIPMNNKYSDYIRLLFPRR